MARIVQADERGATLLAQETVLVPDVLGVYGVGLTNDEVGEPTGLNPEMHIQARRATGPEAEDRWLRGS